MSIKIHGKFVLGRLLLSSGRYSNTPIRQTFCKSATALNHTLLSQSDLQLARNRGLEQFTVASLQDTDDVKFSSNHSSAMLKYLPLMKGRLNLHWDKHQPISCANLWVQEFLITRGDFWPILNWNHIPLATINIYISLVNIWRSDSINSTNSGSDGNIHCLLINRRKWFEKKFRDILAWFIFLGLLWESQHDKRLMMQESRPPGGIHAIRAAYENISILSLHL